MANKLKQLMLCGILEGISFILLLFIAMPVKYLLGNQILVKYLGWVHGVLFVWYIYILIELLFIYRWSLMNIIKAFIASLLPFGTFYLHASWKKERTALLN
jgi:integral membrane protein